MADNEKFEFSVFQHLLNYGNRTDVEAPDGGWEEGSFSWEAEEIDFRPDAGFGAMNAAAITAFDETREQKYLIAWKRIYE